MSDESLQREHDYLDEDEIMSKVGQQVYFVFIPESGHDKWVTVKADWDFTWYRATWLVFDHIPERYKT